jgi:hypothetical protein
LFNGRDARAAIAGEVKPLSFNNYAAIARWLTY